MLHKKFCFAILECEILATSRIIFSYFFFFFFFERLAQKGRYMEVVFNRNIPSEETEGDVSRLLAGLQ